jgi:hypothetical protein
MNKSDLNLTNKKVKKEKTLPKKNNLIEVKNEQYETSENNEINISERYEETEINNKKEITYNKKLEIVKKINKIKKKEYLLNIFKIITTYSEEYTENTNGVFIFFHNLPDEAYEKIENYLNVIYKLHLKSDIKNIFDSELSDINITETIYNNIEMNNQHKDLTNKEKMILRRKKYEEYLQQNQNSELI